MPNPLEPLANCSLSALNQRVEETQDEGRAALGLLERFATRLPINGDLPAPLEAEYERRKTDMLEAGNRAVEALMARTFCAARLRNRGPHIEPPPPRLVMPAKPEGE